MFVKEADNKENWTEILKKFENHYTKYACLKIVKFLPDNKPLKYALHIKSGPIGRPPKPPHMVR